MSITIDPKTGRVQRKTTQQLVKDVVSKKTKKSSSSKSKPKKEDAYAELTDDGISEDVMRKDESGEFVKTGEKLSEEQKNIVERGESFPTSTGRTSKRSRRTRTTGTPSKIEEKQIDQTTIPQSPVVQRTSQNMPYVTDPITRTSRPLFQTSPISQTSP
ncbi:MAG: hypothetical protein ACOC4L_03760, partial [Halanaerobium sp.]